MSSWMRSSVLVLIIGCVLLAWTATAQDAPATTEAPIKQVYCPVTPTEEIDAEVYTDYKGTRVYFCCDRCRVKFIRDPEKYGVRLVGNASDQVQPAGPDHEPGAEHSHHDADEPQTDAPAQEEAEHHHDGGAPKSISEGEEHEHPHARGGGIIAWLGRFHPAATDFPIALLSAALAAEVLFVLRKRTLFDDAGRFCIWGAALTGVVTATLGWFFAGFRLVDGDRLLLIHRWMGTGAALFIVLVLVLSERTRSEPARTRGLYRTVLFRHYWVVAKLALTSGATVVLLLHMPAVGRLARIASAPSASEVALGGLPAQDLVHAVGGVVVLLGVTAISVYKPWGRTPYGRRRLAAIRGQDPGPADRAVPIGAPAERLAAPRLGAWAVYAALAFAVLALLMLAMHVAGGGITRH